MRPGVALSRQTATLIIVLFAALHGVRLSDAAEPFPSGIAVWDTGRPSADPLTPADLERKDGWARTPRNEKPAVFLGDIVMANGRVVAVLRKRDSDVMLFSLGPRGAVLRTRLRLLTPGGEPAARLDKVTLVENTRSAARLEASFRTASGNPLVAMFRLKRGEVTLETEPGTGAGRLRVDCPGRFVVLPDFFADDILIDARKIPISAIDVPSENFLLHMTGGGDAIAMCVFENRAQDVKVSLMGEGERRVVTGSEIDFGEGRKVWVALMEAPQIWHMLDVALENGKNIKRLDWKMPYTAQWRIDFTRPNELVDSWEFLLWDKDDHVYRKSNWLGHGAVSIGSDRARWTTVLGWFRYPCWIDEEGRGFLEPLRHDALSFQGPAVIYPINRVGETPIDIYTVTDIMRNSLGVGPCEYILDVEGQKQELKGRATCAARDALQVIYYNNQQKQKRKEIEAALNGALAFVTHIRSRITQYVEFGHEVRQYLAQQRSAQPELREFLQEMDKIVSEIDVRVKRRRQKIQTPKFVAALNERFRQNLLGYEGPDVKDRLREYTDVLTQIGANQDELVGGMPLGRQEPAAASRHDDGTGLDAHRDRKGHPC